MSLRNVESDNALPSAARGAGTFTSGPIAAAGAAAVAILAVHCTAASGTGPTLNASLEESSDGATWTAIAGSSIVQLAAAGNALAHAVVSKNFVRVTSAVAGTTPSFTYSATVLVAAAS